MKHKISIAFQTDKSAAQYIALAKLVNQYDFDVVTVYCDLPYHPPFAPLMLMAPHTERAQVGVAAIPPSRIHPVDIAAQTALLAEIAAGGVYIGLARGAWLQAHAIQEQQPSIQSIREAGEVIRYLLGGSTGGYQGHIYRLADHVRAPYPLPNYRVPLLIGTWGKQLGKLAGEVADEVKVGGSANPDFVPIMQSYIKAGEVAANRPAGTVQVVMGAVSVIDEDQKLARRIAKEAVALYLPVVAALDPTVQIETALLERIQGHVNRHEQAQAGALISDELLSRFAFAGNVEDFIDHANRLFEAGAGRVEFGTPHGMPPEKGIRLIGEHVIPELRKTWR